MVSRVGEDARYVRYVSDLFPLQGCHTFARISDLFTFYRNSLVADKPVPTYAQSVMLVLKVLLVLAVMAEATILALRWFLNSVS